MFLTIVGPVGHEETAVIHSGSRSLGALLREYDSAVEACFINSRPTINWRSVVSKNGDRVKIHLRTGEPATIIGIIVSLVVSAITMGIQMALAPKPAKLNADNSQAFGISGFQNTTGQGTPIPVCYGINRVTPHIIASGIDVSADHKDMLGRVLYCVGDSGGDEYEAITNVEIDDVPIEQYQGAQVHFRYGSLSQSVIPEFNNVSAVWYEGITFPWDDFTNVGSYVFRTNKSDAIDRTVLTIAFPSGLWRTNATGKRKQEFATLAIWYIRVGDDANIEANWHKVPPTPEFNNGINDDWQFADSSQSALYYKIQIDHGSRDHWRLRFLVTNEHDGFPDDEPHSASMQLYNVEEIEFTTETYPGFVLLGLVNIPAKQIKSLQSMKVTCLVSGKKVSVPGFGSKIFTRSRQWIVRDMMTGPCGMDYEFSDSELDLTQWQNESAYYQEEVPGHITATGSVTSATGSGGTADTIHLDTAVTLGSGTNFLTIRNAEHNEYHAIANPVGTYTTLFTVGDFSFVPDPGDEFTVAQAEVRDTCDFLLNQRKWDIDWVRAVAGEGRACVVPSGLLWKYLIEKPGDPNLLFCEPGNIIENSIQIDVSPPEDDPYNQILAEFRDETDNYNPALTEPVDGPDTPYPSTIQKAVHFDTITRESQAIRECMVVIKRQFLERRKWSLTSPIGKIVSEPLDIDWMSERQLGDIGSYTGILPSGSFTTGGFSTTVNLPEAVTLEVSTTYILIVQRRDNSPSETRTVTTGPGTWAQVTVSGAYTVVPAEGDWFALGELLVDNIRTRAREITVDSEGRVKQLRSEYVEEVYNQDPIPPKRIRRHFPYVSVPPIPLRDAAVHTQLVQRVDGSWATIIIYDVTPGLIKIATRITGIAWPKFYIPIAVLPPQIQAVSTIPANSFQRFYFSGAYWQFTSGQSIGQRLLITDFDPNPVSSGGEQSYNITLDGSPIGLSGDEGFIEWVRFSDTAGFKIELSTDGLLWSEVARVTGFHYEIDGGDQGGTFYYRFTPFNNSEVENKIARLVKGPITISGDTKAPPAPVAVMAFATIQFITVEATFQLPMALDFAGIEIFVDQYRYVPERLFEGIVIHTRTDATRENGTTGTVKIRKTVDVRNAFRYIAVPSVWTANVRAYDYSGNKSAFVLSNDFSPQKLDAGDIA